MSFFFQAEDGIRDLTVTGVQTCALPIYRAHHGLGACIGEHLAHDAAVDLQHGHGQLAQARERGQAGAEVDRKSTRLNSSHSQISYAVFCLKKKKTKCYSSCSSC